jgi:hypothetical protein
VFCRDELASRQAALEGRAFGQRSFLATLSYDAGTNPDSVAMGDFNGDGIPDLAVANGAAANGAGVSVLLGNGDGTFQHAVTYPAGTFFPECVAVGDFNGDGVPDLAVANAGTQYAGTVSILLGNGDGTFRPAVNYAAGATARSTSRWLTEVTNPTTRTMAA